MQTVDYITPIVDDPEAFGAIAAANALSDIYAMGGRPVLALNLVGFPIKTLPMGILEAILRGGEAKLSEAGVTLGGGHSIEDLEPKYGLAVTGVVDPQRVITNAGAQLGDILVLTKPLGSGIITTGIDRGLVREETIRRVTALMAQLNRVASDVMVAVGVDACTDVSGFGLLGHLHELITASGVAARCFCAPCTCIARSLGPGSATRDPGWLAQQRALPGSVRRLGGGDFPGGAGHLVRCADFGRSAHGSAGG